MAARFGYCRRGHNLVKFNLSRKNQICCWQVGQERIRGLFVSIQPAESAYYVFGD